MKKSFITSGPDFIEDFACLREVGILVITG